MTMSPSPPPPFEHFSHDADIGVRGRGETLEQAFGRAAQALTAVVAEPGTVREKTSVDIRCEPAEPEILLFDWLNTVIFEMATRRLLFARYEVTLDDDGLTARAFGEPVEVGRHHPAVEVKGATMTGLRVARETDGTWVAECVVDV
jgi:SHS2 domain-containing protein